MTDLDFVYDIETYLDIFCADITHVATRTRWIFEVSDRVDQSADFVRFIYWLRDSQARMFGFNNVGFDYPVIHQLVQRETFTALDAHKVGTNIITSNDRWANNVWPSDRIVTQGDLYLIHHFDNFARSTGLKKLEINMRSATIEDLPYPPDKPTTSEQKSKIVSYMCHDVSETLKFYHASIESIRFRDELTQRYPELGDVLNMNDTKIGKKFFEMELEKAGTPCYTRINRRRAPLQTLRDSIALRDVISPKVTFQHPEFQRILDWLNGQVLTKAAIDESLKNLSGNSVDDETGDYVETKGVFKNVSATIDGFKYVFGTGGIHGSVKNQIVSEDDEYEIWDWDVASYYPNLGISNGFFPAHLSETFCAVNKYLYEERLRRGKKTADGAVLKLALNGVYGDSNNKYSPFYDPQYTMSITVNGQLMLCMLAEWLRRDGLTMIQINTDGLTVRVRKDAVQWMMDTCKAWEQRTGLELESVQYGKMIIRDVNSYIAVSQDGTVKKRIGAYAYLTPMDDKMTRERQWHQNHSMLVCRKAAEAQMVHGVPVRKFIMNHSDPFDFMLSVKVPRSSRLLHGDEKVQNTSRFYVSIDGENLTKIMPGLKDGPERHFSVQSGWRVTLANDVRHFRWDNINWLYYITESEKLVIDEQSSTVRG